MNLTDALNLTIFSDPIQMPVSELLAGAYVFSIPSYQRGYRWESRVDANDQNVRQVDDLLNDLTHFVDANATVKANYYLQPLMVKPRYENGSLLWDVLDGQQRLTTMLLILKCLNEKLCSSSFPLYRVSYANRPDIDYGKITFDRSSPDFDYPKPNRNLDSFFVRKAKDKILEWFENTITTQQKKDKFKEALFYEDNSREPSSTPNLRVLFVWYNAEPIASGQPQIASSNSEHDIAIFNRLNGGKISLTNSELLKALFMLCIKTDKERAGSSLVEEETLVRKWDEMERKFQDEEFWNMLCPKTRVYENRLDFLFDFIREGDPRATSTNSYRYYYNEMKSMLTVPNSTLLDTKWDEIKRNYDTLCKWHENTTLHNYIGYLVEFGKSVSDILKEINQNAESAVVTVKNLVKKDVKIEGELSALRYGVDNSKIRKILVLFNVETSEKHGEKFSFNKYRTQGYDIEHVNSQTDNAIVKPNERLDWVRDQALASLSDDLESIDTSHVDYQKITALKIEGNRLLGLGEAMHQRDFVSFRQDVDKYYTVGCNQNEKDWIGNLTLLNSSINREYQNALFPQKLRTIKRNDQEGAYIPLCTKYLFLKYYSNIKGHVSAFTMMRWRDEDQNDYYEAIKRTLGEFLQ